MPVEKMRQSKPAELVGVVPSAGMASRIGALPCSKELLPVGFHHEDKKDTSQVKVVSHYLIEKMRRVNVSKVYIILRKGKWDIPAYFGDGKNLGIPLAYLMMDLPFGVPYTLDQAYPFVKDSVVVFGFPDILFEPEDAFEQLLTRQTKSGSDIVLGLFSTSPHHKGDMVTLKHNEMLESIQVNTESADRGHTWIIVAWTSKFTHFMHEYIVALQRSEHEIKTDDSNFKELFMGDVIRAAFENGLSTEVVNFSEGNFLDIGSPENLAKGIRTDL
jgi:glucose-1-phosphate thymidylyltransferase